MTESPITYPNINGALSRITSSILGEGKAASNFPSLVADLRGLVDVLRPRRADDVASAIAHFEALCSRLEAHSIQAGALKLCVQQVFAHKKQVSFLADAGILPNSGFFSELWRRVVQRIFPAINDADSLKDFISQIFHQRDDAIWLDNIPTELKIRLWRALNLSATDIGLTNILAQMLCATEMLAIRIASMGLEPELARLYPNIEALDSPFIALAAEVQQRCAARRRHLNDADATVDDELQLMVLIAQCREIITKVRARAAAIGTSLRLTYLLRRLVQSLDRLEMLEVMLAEHHQRAIAEAIEAERSAKNEVNLGLDADPVCLRLGIEFLHAAIAGEARRKGIREHIGHTIGLLALRITDNASRTGEHYITSTRIEYLQMWRTAMAAGFIVGFMALLKLFSSQAAMAPLGYFMAYALNYAGGFMLIHMLHLTLATKQPAMTASTIAGAIGDIRTRARDVKADVERLAGLVVDLIRSQIAAILGNVLLAIPTAILLSMLFAAYSDAPLMSPEKAHKLIDELSAFESLSLFHAAIAGVCLFIAGQISGYYDNLAAYERIRERIEHAQWLQRFLGANRLSALATYLDNNLGALAGNFFLGLMLAMVGTIGFLTGLPLDVRHVTLSSANFGLALAALNFAVDFATIAKTLGGIALIGFVNLGVSFSLALLMALRARGAEFGQTRLLTLILFKRLKAEPRQFFFPPKTDEVQQTPR